MRTPTASPKTSPPMPPSRPFLPYPDLLTQTRQATTSNSPTPNQFAKNAAAAYAKQKQPQYQSKPREPPSSQKPLGKQQPQQHPQNPQRQPKPSPPPDARPQQDVGAQAQAAAKPESRLARILKSIIPPPGYSPDQPPSRGTGTYSVHHPTTARQKLKQDASPDAKPTNPPTPTSSEPTAAQVRLAHRQQLGYKAVNRRILAIMVGIPVFVVTSIELWRRFVRGEGRREFPSGEGMKGFEWVPRRADHFGKGARRGREFGEFRGKGDGGKREGDGSVGAGVGKGGSFNGVTGVERIPRDQSSTG